MAKYHIVLMLWVGQLVVSGVLQVYTVTMLRQPPSDSEICLWGDQKHFRFVSVYYLAGVVYAVEEQ